MTSQPPQDEVEEVARAIYNIDPYYESGEYVDGFQISPSGYLTWEQAQARDAEFGDDPIFIKITDIAYRSARAAIATIDRLRSAAPAAEWSFDMDAAPKDEWIWVWCPAVEGLAPLLSLCLWHEDAGFCVDEIRTPVCWTNVQHPGHPKEPVGMLDRALRRDGSTGTRPLPSRGRRVVVASASPAQLDERIERATQ